MKRLDRRGSALLLAGALCLGAAPQAVLAQTAAGAEFRVNSSTRGDQGQPAVAAAPDGRYVVVWESEGQDGSLGGIYGQRYNASGVRVGGEFRVNTSTAERQTNPAVAINASGDFIVAWDSATHLAASTGVYAQRYNADGSRRGSEMRLNGSTRDIGALVSVALDNAGNFIAVWPERGTATPLASNIVPVFIVAQRFDANGSAREALITVSSSYVNNLRVPSVGIDDHGGFVVAWNADNQPGFATQSSNLGNFVGVFASRFGADGKALDFGFQVDSAPIGIVTGGLTSDRPVLAVAPDGRFALAWQTYADDGSSQGIFLRRYDAAGTAQGPAQVVDAARLQRKPALAINAAGQLVVAGHSDGLYLRRYASDGVATGATQRADGATTSNEILQPGISLDTSGRIVAVWQVRGLDGSGRGVYARRYNP